MALIFPGSTCALCEEPLDKPYTATSGVVFPKSHRLYRFCDAPLHFECLERWPDREAFSAGYFDEALKHFRNRANLLAERPDWILGAGPTKHNQKPSDILKRLNNELPHYAEVRLPDWPFRLYSYWTDWDAFLAGSYQEGLAGEAIGVSDKIMAEVKQIAPSSQSLLVLLGKSYR